MHSRWYRSQLGSYQHKIGPITDRQKQILADPQTSGGLLVAVEGTHTAAFERSWRTTACRRNTAFLLAGWSPCLRRLRNLRRSGWSPPPGSRSYKAAFPDARAAFTALRSRPGYIFLFYLYSDTITCPSLAGNIVVKIFRLYAEWCVATFFW